MLAKKDNNPMKIFKLFTKDDDVFCDYRDRINELNYERIGKLSMMGATLPIMAVVFFFIVGDFEGSFESAMIMIYFATLRVVYNFRGKDRPFKNSTIIFYLVVVPILLFAASVDSYFDPEEEGFTSLLFLCVIPCLIIDKPRRLWSFMIGVAVTYGVIFDFYNDGAVMEAFTSHIAVASIVSIVISGYVLTIQIENIRRGEVLSYQSEHDGMTGLFNRAGGEKRISEYLEEGCSGFFYLIDVDNFKEVNDSFGHDIGDEVLEDISGILTESSGDKDVLMRIGGDEFVGFAQGVFSEEMIQRRFERIQSGLRWTRFFRNYKQKITLSMGAVILDSKTDYTYKTLYKTADELLYTSKRNGKNVLTAQ